MPEKGLDLAKNETFSIPSSVFFLCHKGVLNWYSKGTRAKWNYLCLVWWLFLSQYTFKKAVSLPSGMCMTCNSRGKRTLHLIGWSTFGLNFKILFLLLSL